MIREEDAPDENTERNNVHTECFWRKERGNVLIPDSGSQEETHLGISAAVNGSMGFKAHVVSLEKADKGTRIQSLKIS